MVHVPVITAAKVVHPYVLEVTFKDGVNRHVDVEPLLFGDVFEPLRDPETFGLVRVDEELGTVVWPNGADLSPEFLYGAEQLASSPRRG